MTYHLQCHLLLGVDERTSSRHHPWLAPIVLAMFYEKKSSLEGNKSSNDSTYSMTRQCSMTASCEKSPQNDVTDKDLRTENHGIFITSVMGKCFDVFQMLLLILAQYFSWL